jgi:hypothetical protein
VIKLPKKKYTPKPSEPELIEQETGNREPATGTPNPHNLER